MLNDDKSGKKEEYIESLHLEKEKIETENHLHNDSKPLSIEKPPNEIQQI
jgi:hypothetical protein